MKEIKDFLRGYGLMVVAFSGGVDSSLLMDLAVESLGRDKVLGLFMNMGFQSQEDVFFVWQEAEARNWPVEEITLPWDQVPDQVLANPKRRCYWCKKMIFSRLLDVAKKRGYAVVCDGSNVDDLGDYRPGRQALEELGVVSPFLACGWTKAEIRKEAKKRGLRTWNRASNACLASRIPYDHGIERKDLKRIQGAESYLRGLGYEKVRVRTLGSRGRIEVDPSQVCQAQKDLERLTEALKEFAYQEIEVDPAGYRQGSLHKEKK